MQVTYATSHKWVKDVTSDPLDHFGKSAKKYLRSSIEKIKTLDIVTEVIKVDEAFLDWFVPMCEERVNSKKNPRVFDIRCKTFTKAKKQYYAVILKEKGVYIGATIFSLPKDRFSIAYRTYNNSWTYNKLHANPSLYTEYVINKLAIEKGCNTIVHGKDNNPYGINSNIGLAAFKLSGGSHPEKSRIYELSILDTHLLKEDVLVFEYPGDNMIKISKGYLIVSRSTQHKWMQVTKYPHLVDVEIVYRD